MFNQMRGLIIAAYPNRYDGNDEMCDYFRKAFESCDIKFSTFDLCDDRYHFTRKDIQSYDLIVLAGGHTPTQNKYFKDIDLKEKIKGFDGIVVGISAGSMNLAENVYFQPEEPGESGSLFIKDGKGLGLSDIKLTPHLQMIRKINLDGKSLVYDLIVEDSKTRKILGLNDGSYVYIGEDDKPLIYGEAYMIKNGDIIKINNDNEIIEYK